jgi:pimeloyl-ACP methyl ester carboxylesterase
LARQLIVDYDIKADAVVIGSSLGGMVACEIAHLRQNQQVVLVGSATSRTEISALLQWLHPLIDHAPLSLLQWSAGSCPLELTRMFQTSSPAFLRTMSKAVFAWNGYDTSLPRPLRIHGIRDLVIPCPKNVDCIVDGGHLIAMSHSKECVDFILANLTQDIQSGITQV